MNTHSPYLRRSRRQSIFNSLAKGCPMALPEIELNPIDFITLGTVGPKGRRQFNIQAGQGSQIVTLTLEKEQARRIAEAIEEMLTDLYKRFPTLIQRRINL